MSFLTGTNVELIYASTAAGTAKNTFTTEVAINDEAGMGVQALIPSRFFAATTGEKARALLINAAGIVSSTATPTYTFTVRGGAQAATTGAVLGGTAALTTGSGISNQYWEMFLRVVLETRGSIGANSTIRGTGSMISPGFANKIDPVYGNSASPGTATTFNPDIDNFINFNVACSASSASNTITLHQLLVYGLN